ncbi:polymer-forming cytoskeletal protein [Alicyclobacillus fastidiosus]|uniref:Polymer-forming cytoskeletal protein n=1 Tax=Alicyclobacillus fastidiosus TaxID=392011 RepID=A0ABV5ADT3_9BACL|nr:polymer-forming cytoskeletal protein [Alicyclobacillus fastidiosus]WEH08612.1 polymer-forming cytoskeletal protein [Alicyclobacillus fastidiosus]
MSENTVRPNLDLSGVGSATGGLYHDVKVQGIGKVHGDIDCIRCDIEGVSEILGHVRAEVVHVRGKAKVQGDLFANDIDVEGATSVAGKCEAQQKLRIRGRVSVRGDVSGDVVMVEGINTVEGDCRGQDVKVRGKARVSGSIFAEEVFLEGVMRVGGSCETETFRSDGTFVIDGLLTADRIFVRLERKSRVKEIGGEEIRVERGNWSRFLNRSRRLTADVIEGDEIYLEHTKARVVRGNHVTLGPSTQVDLVEYFSDLKTIGNAKVGASKKL